MSASRRNVHDASVQNQTTLNSERADPELERVSRLIVAGELVAAVAHDLRQPVTATEMNVSAALRLLRTASTTRRRRRQETRSRRPVRRYVMRSWSSGACERPCKCWRTSCVSANPCSSPMDAVALVNEAVQLVMSEVSARHTVIELKIPTSMPRIVADGVLVRQALLNILMNALESTSASRSPAGPITVAMHSDDGAGIVEVVITHYGPPDERCRRFRAGARAGTGDCRGARRAAHH